MKIERKLKTGAKLLALLASAFLLFGAVGCSDGGDDNTNTTTTTTPTQGGSGDGNGGTGGGGNSQPDTSDIPELEVEGEIDRVTPSATATTATITAPTATATTGVSPDADIVVTASAKPATVTIYESSTLVDTINAANEMLYSGEQNGVVALNVKDQLIIQQGSVIIVKPHFDSDGYTKLGYGKTYTVKFDGTEVLSFTTKATEPAISGNTINVGTGTEADFATIQGALNYLQKNNKTGDWTINVAEGSYHERLYYKGDANVTLVGPTDSGATAYGDKAIIYWKNFNGWNDSTRGRTNFLWKGGNLTLKNVTLKSTYTRKGDNTSSDSRNEVLYFDSKSNLVAYDCSFIGTQDTLILGNNGGRAWFYKDYIEGDVDFIWGTLDVGLFEECVIGITDEDTSNGYIFAANTVETNEVNKGFVLFNSTIRVPTSSFKAYYGRTAGGTGTNAAIINCTLTNMLEKTLWNSASGKRVFEDNGDVGVGFKDYGNVLSDGTEVDVSGRLDQTYTMSKRVALREYNGRYAILNRGFDVNSLTYKFGTEWDISAYETEFNATADESNKNVYVEPVFQRNVVGGTDIQLEGSSAESGVTYTDYESSDTSIATVDSTGKVTAASGVEGWAVVTMTASNGKKDYFQIGVIQTEIPATAVSVAVEDTSVAKYGLTTATISFTPATATYKEFKLTSSDTNLKFYDSANKKLVSELTTEESSVRVWFGGDITNATITAASTHDTSAAKGTATVSTKTGVSSYTSAEAWMRGGEANGLINFQQINGMWEDMIVDGETYKTVGSTNSKFQVTAAEKIQARQTILYIPVSGKSDIQIDLNSSAQASTTMYFGIGNSTTNNFTASTNNKTYTYSYDGSKTGIVLGSDDVLQKLTLSTSKGTGGSVSKNTKYLKVIVGGTTDRYISAITVTRTGEFTAIWEETPVAEGADGSYNLVKSSNTSDTFTATDETNGIYNYESKDGYVKVTGLDTKSNNSYGVVKSATATIKLGGPSKITWTGANGGTRTTFKVTESEGSTTLVDAVTTSWADSETLSFIYTGTAETTLTLTWGAATSYIKTLKVESIETTEANVATKVEISGESSVTTTSKLKATVTPKYLNTNTGCVLADSVSWTSSAESYATVTKTTALGEIDKTTGLYTSDEATVTYVANGDTTITASYGSASATKSITASASAVEYTQYSWNFMKAVAGTSWASAESSSKSITSTTSWSASNNTHGISGKATTMTIPTDGAASVYVFITYQGNNTSTLGLYDGDTQIGTSYDLAVSDTKAGKAYAWRYTGSSKTLSLKIADKTSGSQGTTYIGSIYVDRSAMPSSLTACTYDLTNSATFDGSVAASAGDTTLFWHEVSSNTSTSNANGYYNGNYGLQENNGTYLAFVVGGACKITLNVSYNGSSSTQTATLYNSAHTSQGTATIAATLNGGKSNPTGYDFTYSGSADILYIALPATGTCISSVAVAAQ